MYKFFLISSIFLFGKKAYSQWQMIGKEDLSGVEHFDQDPSGNMYLSLTDGNVVKYSSEGKKLLDYSPIRIAPVDDIKISSQFRVALFYEGLQEVVILDRWLGSPITYKLSDFGLGYISAIGPNQQQNIWVLDMSEFSLKLIDPTRGHVLEVKSLAQILGQRLPDVSYFRSHENLMYVGIEDKVLIFDVMGNFVKSVEGIPENVRWFQKKMYWVKGDTVSTADLYTGQTTDFVLPKKNSENVLFNGNRLAVFTEEGFTIYKYLSTR